MHWVAELIISITTPVIAGTLVGLLTAGQAKVQYALIRKPIWSPPSWVFGLVWPILYALMGVAAWLVWRAPVKTDAERKLRKMGLILYVVQLVVNLVWSFVYFSLGAKTAALGVIIVLDILVVTTAIMFGGVDPWAAGILIPYGLWLMVATALNASVVALN